MTVGACYKPDSVLFEHLNDSSVFQAVMAEAYDIIAHIFLKHLIRTSRKKLERWSSAVDQAVSSYTEELQRTVSELVGVKTGLHGLSHSSDPSECLTLTRF